MLSWRGGCEKSGKARRQVVCLQKAGIPKANLTSTGLQNSSAFFGSRGQCRFQTLPAMPWTYKLDVNGQTCAEEHPQKTLFFFGGGGCSHFKAFLILSSELSHLRHTVPKRDLGLLEEAVRRVECGFISLAWVCLLISFCVSQSPEKEERRG